MKPLRSYAISFALAAVAGSFALEAHAEAITVVLKDGTQIVGDVGEIAAGDHVAVKLPNGDVKVLAWADLASLQVGVSGAIVIGAPSSPSTTGAPPPPVVATPESTSPPPPIVYAPQAPPPPVVYAPPPAPQFYPQPQEMPPPPSHVFIPRWNFGLRIGSVSPGKNTSLIGASDHGNGGDDVGLSSYVSSGLSIEGDVGYHFSPSWTFYGFWEHDFLGRGDANGGASEESSSNFVGIGVNANTNPQGPVGFFFDVATGYRWLSFAAPTGPGGSESRYTFSGFEALRLGLGVSLVTSHSTRVDLMVVGSAGYFSHYDETTGSGACFATSNCGDIPSERRAIHSFGGLSVAIHRDLL